MSTELQVVDIQTLVLKRGGHASMAEGCCIMEAVSWLAREPWSDRPSCSCPGMGDFLRSWNDSCSDEVRQQLKRYIPRLVGTNDGKTDVRTWILVDWALRVHLPLFLDALRDEEASRCAGGLRGLSEINASTARSELERAIPFINSSLDRARALDLDLARALDRALDLARGLVDSRHAVMERMLAA